MKNLLIGFIIISSFLLIGCGESKEVATVKNAFDSDFSNSITIEMALENRPDCKNTKWEAGKPTDGITVVTYSCTVTPELEQLINDKYLIYDAFLTKVKIKDHERYYNNLLNDLELAKKKLAMTRKEKQIKDNMKPWLVLVAASEWDYDVISTGTNDAKKVISGKMISVKEQCYDNPEGTPECSKEIENAKAFNLYVESVKELVKYKKHPEWEAKRLITEIAQNDITTENKLAREEKVVNEIENKKIPTTLKLINGYKYALENPPKEKVITDIKESITWSVDRFGTVRLGTGMMSFNTPITEKGFVAEITDPYLLLSWAYNVTPMDKLSNSYVEEIHSMIK